MSPLSNSMHKITHDGTERSEPLLSFSVIIGPVLLCIAHKPRILALSVRFVVAATIDSFGSIWMLFG